MSALVTKRPRGAHAINDRHRAIAQARADGVPVAEVAARFGVSVSTVSRVTAEVAAADLDARRIARLKESV